MTRGMIAICGLLFATTIAAAPPRAIDPGQLSADIKGMDIGGLYWGQPEADAMRVLKSRGYEIEAAADEHLREPFDRQVERVASGEIPARLKYTHLLRAKKPGEQIQLTLASFSDGWRVHHVIYEYDGGLTVDEMNAAAKEKYEKRGFQLKDWNFCMTQTTNCSRLPHVRMYGWSASGFSLELKPGDIGSGQLHDEFDAAVRERKGKAKPTF